MTKPIVAIVGRQNVGKSTLLNRLAGKRIAIVSDVPGTTRDRIVTSVFWKEREFVVVDTGGLETGGGSDIAHEVNQQVKTAIDGADAIIFLVDVRDGITASDSEIADILRSSAKPLLLAANKADNNRLEAEVVEFFSLGLGEPLPISAYHGRGIFELVDKIVSLLPEAPVVEAGGEQIRIAIVGRPNVGKSMLLNALLGEPRVIVSDVPGTTRDAIDTQLDFEGQSVLLIDTAGIKRRGRVGKGIAQYSVLRSLRAIDRADVVLLVLDATELVVAQDVHIAGYIQQAARGIALVVNKWDLVVNSNKTECSKYVRNKLKFVPYAPVLYTSAKLGQGTDKVIPRAQQIYRERLKRIPTTKVNSVIQRAAATHIPPRSGKKQLKMLYATQADVNPPTFVFFVNDSELVHFSYRRYLENRLRQSFGFDGTPLRLIFKNRSEQC
ncbi:MAG TPA: ribosome biogenesis GTPase Der [Dehalococcoidia bacterium]|nr:ribosome biogenesis GTPase Der [Dehalococcoidia bacterium]